jgi:hypothetical protein
MDLIKREDAIKAIEEWAVNLGNPKMLVREDAILALKDIPPAEKQGEWERIPYSFVGGFRCSCCGIKTLEKHWNFCPNCGARMKGADNE